MWAVAMLGLYDLKFVFKTYKFFLYHFDEIKRLWLVTDALDCCWLHNRNNNNNRDDDKNSNINNKILIILIRKKCDLCVFSLSLCRPYNNNYKD